MTPLEAMNDPEGREMVEALLRESERRQEEAPAEQPPYDFDALRLRLGLGTSQARRKPPS